jgi:hypothetical protein
LRAEAKKAADAIRDSRFEICNLKSELELIASRLLATSRGAGASEYFARRAALESFPESLARAPLFDRQKVQKSL